MTDTIQEYDAKLDSRKRIIIRNASYEYYHVSHHKNGTITLEPRELVAPLEISKKTLKMIDSSMRNFEKGIVSEEIDLSEFEDQDDV